MKTYLVSHNQLGNIYIGASPSDIYFLKKIYTIKSENNTVKKQEFELTLHNPTNRQTNRIQLTKGFMMRDRDFIIIHGILCSINNKKVIIGGASKSGKTFLYNYLYTQGYIDNLYDEDLCCLYTDENKAFALSNFSFIGMKLGKYAYRKNLDNIYGVVDYVFLLDPQKETIKKGSLTGKNILKYLVHENLHNIQNYYQRCPLKYKVSTYIMGNNYHNSKDVHLKNATFILKEVKCVK